MWDQISCVWQLMTLIAQIDLAWSLLPVQEHSFACSRCSCAPDPPTNLPTPAGSADRPSVRPRQARHLLRVRLSPGVSLQRKIHHAWAHDACCVRPPCPDCAGAWPCHPTGHTSPIPLSACPHCSHPHLPIMLKALRSSLATCTVLAGLVTPGVLGRDTGERRVTDLHPSRRAPRCASIHSCRRLHSRCLFRQAQAPDRCWPGRLQRAGRLQQVRRLLHRSTPPLPAPPNCSAPCCLPPTTCSQRGGVRS